MLFYKPFRSKRLAARFILTLTAVLVTAFALLGLIGPGTAPAADQERVALLTDQENGTFTIVIDGATVAVFDSDGVHVRGNIRYGGTITDIGEAGEKRDAP